MHEATAEQAILLEQEEEHREAQQRDHHRPQKGEPREEEAGHERQHGPITIERAESQIHADDHHRGGQTLGHREHVVQGDERADAECPKDQMEKLCGTGGHERDARKEHD